MFDHSPNNFHTISLEDLPKTAVRRTSRKSPMVKDPLETARSSGKARAKVVQFAPISNRALVAANELRPQTTVAHKRKPVLMGDSSKTDT